MKVYLILFLRSFCPLSFPFLIINLRFFCRPYWQKVKNDKKAFCGTWKRGLRAVQLKFWSETSIFQLDKIALRGKRIIFCEVVNVFQNIIFKRNTKPFYKVPNLLLFFWKPCDWNCKIDTKDNLFETKLIFLRYLKSHLGQIFFWNDLSLSKC